MNANVIPVAAERLSIPFDPPGDLGSTFCSWSHEMIAELNAEVYRHPNHAVVAVQGEDRIRLMTEDGEETFGDVHANATLDEIKFAMEWLIIGISCGTRRGEVNATYEIGAKWLEFAKAIGQ